MHRIRIFSNSAVMCDPSGTILGKPTSGLFRADIGIPIWVCPEKPIQDPYSNFFVQFSLEKAISGSTTRAFILSFYCNVLQVL